MATRFERLLRDLKDAASDEPVGWRIPSGSAIPWYASAMQA